MNTVANIRSLFAKNALTDELKMQLKGMDPPRPPLNIHSKSTTATSCNRNFSMTYYNSATWLCGCDVQNAFFCYVCLLVDSSLTRNDGWVTRGVTDLKHIREKIIKHGITERHMNNCIEFSLLGTTSIGAQLELHSASRSSIHNSNENVKRNRYVLRKLIDCIIFCSAVESPSNSSTFRGLVGLISESDVSFKQRLEAIEDSTFAVYSETTQNDLFESIYAVCLHLIVQEVQQTDYIAIQVDEASDCIEKSQLAFIVRYELRGRLYERFLGFLTPENYTVYGISNAIFEELEKLGVNVTPQKLIAQSYGGTSMMSDSNFGVQSLISKFYEGAHYIHCYAHELISIIRRVCSQYTAVRIFFANLEGFSLFFSRPNATAVLDKFAKNTTAWNFEAKCAITVVAYKEDIAKCLEQIINDAVNEMAVVREAHGLKTVLEDQDFNFWLSFFNKVIPCCDSLFTQLRDLDNMCVENFQNSLEGFKSAIQCLRISMGGFCKQEVDDSPTQPKQPKYESSFLDTDFCKVEMDIEEPTLQTSTNCYFEDEDTNEAVAKEVCHVILTAIDSRFAFIDHLLVASLFEPKLFSKYKYVFPENEVHTAATAFKADENSLKRELKTIYNRSDFCDVPGALLLLKWFQENDLVDVFHQSVRLLKIICTMPMMTTEGARCFSTLELVKKFVKGNHVNRDKFSALAMCAIEKELMQRTENFNELVIDHFAKNFSMIDLQYKSVS